jgi:hypothetical protein
VRSLRAVLAITAVAALTSCVQVPDGGPVVEARPRGQEQPGQQTFNNPPPPARGASPDAIVAGFLEAREATPLRLPPAKAYLSRRAQDRWHPSQVLIYASHSLPQGEDQVAVRLRDADRIGSSGRWEGRVSADASRLRFPMVREDGEWRIAAPPNALILQRGFYDQNYTSQDTSQGTSIYYFDPTGRILVPEPVHVQQGSQLATALVTALLRGPQRSLRRVEQSFFPPGLAVLVSVAVHGSLASVSLQGSDTGPLSPSNSQLLLAQLAWTLRQDPSIKTFKLTVVNRPVTDSEGDSRIPVMAPEFNRFDPAASNANSLTYALRRGRLVSGAVNRLTKVAGPLGSERLGITRFAVSLDNEKIAAVVPGALQVAVGEDQPVTVLTGDGLLRPAWDFANRLWEVQNRSDGAQVVYVGPGRPHAVRIQGVTGQHVRRFLVSRDGSRFIAVIRGPQQDRIVVSRIRNDADGRVVGASRARLIPWRSPGSDRIRDIGWTSPTTIAVLDQLSSVQGEMRILNVDRSTRPGQVSPLQITGDVLGLATSPDQQTPYAVRSSDLLDLSPAEVNRSLPIEDLHQLTYAG